MMRLLLMLLMISTEASFTAHELNRTDLNKSTQFLQELTAYAHSPAHVTPTYFVLIGCRHSELGCIDLAVHAL